MNNKLIALELLSADSYLVVNKKLVKKFGCTTAVFISNLIDKYKYFQDKNQLIEDGFFITHKKLIEEYGLNDRDIRNCKTILKNANIIEIKRIGIPAKEYYYINWDNLIASINSEIDNTIISPTRSVIISPTRSVRTCNTRSVRTNIIKTNINKNKKITTLENEDSTLKTKNITPNQFFEFWELYPKKADKGKALTAWNKLCDKKDKPAWRDVRKAIIEQKKTPRWNNKQFIPLPTTWLNQSRWLDDPAEMTTWDNEPVYKQKFEPGFDELDNLHRND
jgi:hypothetical protein